MSITSTVSNLTMVKFKYVFLQAEDGIRDIGVTGVQTCALPISSHDVVGKVRKILNIKKVGHTGTLDPDASGVLPICIGKATKVSELILNKDKSYICELTLGINTDTYDSSGEIIEEFDIKDFSIEDIEKAFETQRGEIKQLPPMYSALKVNG